MPKRTDISSVLVIGAGANRTVMKVTLLLQWVAFLPLVWWVGVSLGHGLAGVWWVQLGYRCMNSLWFTTIWQRRHWQRLAL